MASPQSKSQTSPRRRTASAEWFLVKDGWAEAVPRKTTSMAPKALAMAVIPVKRCSATHLGNMHGGYFGAQQKNSVLGRNRTCGYTELCSPQRVDLTTNRQGLTRFGLGEVLDCRETERHCEYCAFQLS